MSYNEMRNRVAFFKLEKHSPYPEDEAKKDILYSCYAKVYNPSIKDIEILKTTENIGGLTLVIRDPNDSYELSNQHFVEIQNRYYKDKCFNIIEVRPNTPEIQYITLLLVEKP